MATDFILPDLGEGIHEAEVLNVMVQEGQAVKEDQPILEVETDKAVLPIECPHAGTVSQVLVKKGQTIKPGAPLLSIEPSGAATPSVNGGAKATKAAAASAPAPKAAAPAATSPT